MVIHISRACLLLPKPEQSLGSLGLVPDGGFEFLQRLVVCRTRGSQRGRLLYRGSSQHDLQFGDHRRLILRNVGDDMGHEDVRAAKVPSFVDDERVVFVTNELLVAEEFTLFEIAHRDVCVLCIRGG